MISWLTGGLLGLVAGMALRRMGVTRREVLRPSLTGRRREGLRALVMLPGWAALMAAPLAWLAVIDVDLLAPLPLHAGTLLGAAVFGAAAGWTGLTPATALAALGGDRLLESLCALAGCLAAGLCVPAAESWLARLRGLFPPAQGTLFRVTLDEPFLLGGGFLALGCWGALLLAVGLCIRRRPAADAPAAEAPSEEPAAAAPPEEPDVPPAPESAPEDAFVAILPGEEPVVVDTAAPDEPDPRPDA